MGERKFVVILSDIHMGTMAPTVCYHNEVHEKDLISILEDIIIYANQIQEVILLGDIFEFCVYSPNEISPSIDDVIAAHPNVLGPKGKIRQALSALQGRMIYIPGDHDMNMTQEDLSKIMSPDGYTIKYHYGAYIPVYDTGILFARGYEFNVLNTPCFASELGPLPWYVMNTSFVYPPIPALLAKAITYRIYNLSNRTVSFRNVTDNAPVSIQTKAHKNVRRPLAYGDVMIKNEQNDIGQPEKYTFGWSVYNAALEFFMIMQMGVLAKAAELGIDVIAHDERSDNIEMVTGSIDLISSGIDAFLISPFNPELLPVIVEDAKRYEIPVIVIDIGTGGADVAAFIVSDNYGGGIYAGEYALILMEKYSLSSRNVAIIKVQETAVYALQRGRGFKSVMEENGYMVVAEVPANSEELLGYEVMKNILASYGNDLAVVFCENGLMTLGAARAIDEAGEKGKIMLIGFDSGPSIIEGILNGSIQGTIAQEPYEMGKIGVEIANSILKGIPVTFDNWTEKLILMEVYLIDENGEDRISIR